MTVLVIDLFRQIIYKCLNIMHNCVGSVLVKAFDGRERDSIRASLMEAGMVRFSAQGIRATRIDDICRDVGIAKGSFYTFFPSKEDLFMTMANARDMAHKGDMLAYLRESAGIPSVVAGGFFDFLMTRINDDPLLKIATDSGELSNLIRKVSPELMAENNQRDAEFLETVAQIFQTQHGLPHASADALEGLMTLMVSFGVSAKHIAAPETFDNSRALLRDMFISRLIRGPYND